MNFGSFGAGFGSFGAGVGGLLPSFTNITSWLRSPTTDGKTLVNSKGTDANLTGVNCLNFDGTDDEINTGYIPQGSDLVIDARIKADTVTGQKTLYGVNGNSGFWFRISNGEWQLYSRNAYIFTTSTGIDPEVGNIYDTRIEYDYSSGDWTAKVKLSTDSTYTTVGSGNRLPPIIGGATVILGQKGSAGYFNGEYYSFKLTEGGNVKVHYPFAEGSGTKTFDVSGSGNHGTITSATWTTEDGIASWNHEYGFDVDGSVKVPALNFKTKQVATFDGVADEVNFGTHAIPASDSIEVIFTPQDEADRGCLYSQGSVPGSFGYAISWDGTADRINTRSRGSGTAATLTTSTNSCVADGTTYKVTYDYDSSAGTITLVLFNNNTGATIETVSLTDLDAGSFNTGVNRPIKVGEDQVNLDDYLGHIHSVKSSFIDVDFQANIGTTTVIDNSGNNNNGTVTVGSGGTATFWGTRVADTSGSLVSADYAAGNLTISNSGGFVHNGSECGVDMVTNDLTSTQLFAIDNSTATQTFVRKDNGNILQILDYSSALTGDDLTRTRNYVG